MKLRLAGPVLVTVLLVLLSTGCTPSVEPEPTGTPVGDPIPTAPAPTVIAAPDLRSNDGPNILVVTMDDMRWDELQWLPNVHRYLTKRGLLFQNSFAPNPLCCPSRASFLTGQYSHNHQVYSHEAPYGFAAFDDHLTIGTRLNEAGYQTALVGKYLNGYGRQQSKVTGGPSVSYVPNGWNDWMVSLETKWPQGSPYVGGTYNYYAFTQNINGNPQANAGIYSSRVIGGEVRELIGEYGETDHPWFIWATPVAPHFGGPAEPDDPKNYRTSSGYVSQFQTPARPEWVRGRFDDRISRAPGTRAQGESEADLGDKPAFMEQPEVTAVEKTALRDVERQRAESLFAWDIEFGTIVDQLKLTRQWRDTIIVFTSDNGYFTGEHRQRLGKVKAYEPSLRVPLVIAGPGVPHGVRRSPITTLDLTATLLDLGSAEPLPAMDGASKVSVFAADAPWTVPIVTEGLQRLEHSVPGFPEGLTEQGIRTGRYKLLRFSTGEQELYDLFKDPLELQSVAADPAYSAVLQQLTAVWERYRDCAGPECQEPLPRGLQVSVERLRQQLLDDRAARRDYYGAPLR